MTAEKVHRLRCDARPNGRTAPPCGTASEQSGGFMTLADFRAYLHTQDWHRSGTKDICPSCWVDGYR